MNETSQATAPISDADRYPCCDPKTCSGCGCCADTKGEETPCC